MHKEKRAFKKNATIKIEPYLAEYIIGKYGVDKKRNGKDTTHFWPLSLYLGEHVQAACQPAW